MGLRICLFLLVLATGTASAGEPELPTAAELKAVAHLAANIQGRLVYTHAGSIWSVALGATVPMDHGPGDFARWSPDGKYLVIARGSDLELLDPARGLRRHLLTGLSREAHGMPMDVYGFGEETGILVILEGTAPVLHRLLLAGGKALPLCSLPRYDIDLSVDQAGTRVVSRSEGALWSYDTETGVQAVYGMGCSPTISPAGDTLGHNGGAHDELALRSWPEGEVHHLKAIIDPDRRWGYHHWSNHPTWLATVGEGGGGESYVVDVRTGRCYRQTWCGGTAYPDVWIAGVDVPAPERGSEAVAPRRHRPAWPTVEQGLVYRWTTRVDDNLAPAEHGGHAARLKAHGTARYDRTWGLLVPAGGWATTTLPPLDPAGGWTVHLACDPGQGSGWCPLVSLRDAENTLVARVDIRPPGLHVFGRNLKGVVLPDALRDRAPFWLGVSFDGQKTLELKVNGTRVAAVPLTAAPAAPAVLTIGDRDNTRPVRVSHLACWNRVLGRDELDLVGSTAVAAIPASHPPRLRLEAELVDAGTLPTAKQLEGYTRALVVHRYRVATPPAAGGPAGEIAVARWGILDGESQPGSVPGEPGTRTALVLERWEDHPELKPELVVNDDDDPTLPLYFEVSTDP